MPTRPFDLARAQAGEPVQFAEPDPDVASVEFLRALHNQDGSVRCLLFIVQKCNGHEYFTERSSKGQYYNDKTGQDIVMAPRKRTVWVAIDHRDFCTTWGAKSKEAAEEAVRRDNWPDDSYSIHAIEIED